MTTTFIYYVCKGGIRRGMVHPQLQLTNAIPYLLMLRRCHPQYLSNRAHRKLSQVGAFDGLRIHTDELQEVICRIAPGTLSHAVVSVSFKQHSSLSTSTSDENNQGHGQHGLVFPHRLPSYHPSTSITPRLKDWRESSLALRRSQALVYYRI